MIRKFWKNFREWYWAPECIVSDIPKPPPPPSKRFYLPDIENFPPTPFSKPARKVERNWKFLIF
jgi:hypothetical protein